VVASSCIVEAAVMGSVIAAVVVVVETSVEVVIEVVVVGVVVVVVVVVSALRGRHLAGQPFCTLSWNVKQLPHMRQWPIVLQ